MSFDNSRNTFNPFNDYSGVVMEQGRVQTDADWNEWLAEQHRRIQAGTLDTMGRAVYPATTPFAFQINPGGASVTIGRGRMYVDGILVENHGSSSPPAATWDPSLAEMSGSPQPPPATDAYPVPYESQPYHSGLVFPATPGDYLVYLDVWQQPVTSIEDPNLIDPAIGIDTTGRLKTVWQVNVMAMPSGTTCASANPTWPLSAGQLTNGTVGGPPAGPCCLTTGSGYTGVENQFYRVEIHNPGQGSTTTTGGGNGATFKWSRENASVQTTVTAIASGTNSAGGSASVLTVTSLGRDQVLGFSAGNWVEITNQTNDNTCQPGGLYQIDSVDPASVSITLTTPLPASFSVNSTATNTYTRLIRWDQSGKIYKGDKTTVWCDLDHLVGTTADGSYGIPVPADGSQLILESGLVVSFALSPSTGDYIAMDYWNFAARTATMQPDPLVSAPPRGIHHHYAQLSIATVGAGGTVTVASECRTQWPPNGEGECGCCTTSTVGPGGTYSTITAAIQALPSNGGQINLLPGDFYENVVLNGVKNLVLRGCGWQTHVFSTALQSAGGAPAAASSTSGLPAVFTLVNCQNVEFTSFSVTAADGEVGILLDRTPDSHKGSTDILLEDLILEASTLPTLVAVAVDELLVRDSRIYRKDVSSEWASVYLAGKDVFFTHNWVGLGSAHDFVTTNQQSQAAPAAQVNSAASIKAKQKAAKKTTAQPEQLSETALSAIYEPAQKSPGGIHIAGPSKNIFIVENDIVGGMRNGITLGNFIILDANGADTGKLTGVLVELEDSCTRTGTGQLPGTISTPGTSTTSKLGSGGIIENVHIDRNRIHKMGMAGIGVVGFWNLRETLEVISILNLSITANVISRTMSREMSPFVADASGFAYGAISLADVENLMIRDNIITDFGYTPGAEVCGIFALHVQMVEISRNQIRETRDWNSDSLTAVKVANDTRSGILMYLATPPTLDGSAWTKTEGLEKIDWTAVRADGLRPDKPVYEPGLPALRVQENIVRVAIGLALEAFGYGPFSVVNNHLASGGPVSLSTKRDITLNTDAFKQSPDSYKFPALVAILNLGLAIEDIDQGDGFYADYARSADADLGAARGLANASIGTVLFTSNTCQLEAWASGVTGLCSVEILSHDHVLFTSNQLWVDAPPISALLDAYILGNTVQMCDNRFQEGQYYPVIASAASVGIANVTAHNIATYCLKIRAPLIYRVQQPNVVIWPFLCPPPTVSQGTKTKGS